MDRVMTWLAPVAIILLAPSFASASSHGMSEPTDMQEALEQGAMRLGADEIADLLVGNTARFVLDSGNEVLVYYGEDNQIAGSSVGGDWTGQGFYGVANDDQVCLSWEGRDEGRLRCLYVLSVDGVPTKFRADGSRFGQILETEEGLTF